MNKDWEGVGIKWEIPEKTGNGHEGKRRKVGIVGREKQERLERFKKQGCFVGSEGMNSAIPNATY